MRIILVFTTACFLFFSVAVSASEETDFPLSRVAVVDVAQLMENAPRSEELREQITRDFLPTEQLLAQEQTSLQELEVQLDSEARSLPDVERVKRSRHFRERKRKYTREFEDFRDRLSNVRQAALQNVRQEVFAAIEAVRAEKQINLVLEDYVTADKNIDITQSVLDYLETQYRKEKESFILESDEAKAETPNEAQ